MPRHHMINNEKVDFTDAEEAAQNVIDQAWADGAAARKLVKIREKRDVLLSETDWMANSDVTMSDAWKAYRKALRDVPAQADMNSITWPTKP